MWKNPTDFENLLAELLCRRLLAKWRKIFFPSTFPSPRDSIVQKTNSGIRKIINLFWETTLTVLLEQTIQERINNESATRENYAIERTYEMITRKNIRKGMFGVSRCDECIVL